MDFIKFAQYKNQWQGSGTGRIDPVQIQYIESVKNNDHYGSGIHSKLHLLNGNIIEICESPDEIAERLKKYFDTHEDKDKIVLTREDFIRSYFMNQFNSINNTGGSK